MNPEQGWAAITDTSGDGTTITLSGEIDMTGAARLQEILQDAVRVAATVLVDLSDVRFIDSTVISALVNGRNTANAAGRRLTVVNPAAQVQRVLQITGVLDTLTR